MCQNELNTTMTEHELHNVCVDVWKFYNEEVLFLFRSLKFILTAAENQNCHYSVSIIIINDRSKALCILNFYLVVLNMIYCMLKRSCTINITMK